MNVNANKNPMTNGSSGANERLNILLQDRARELFARILCAESEQFLHRYECQRDAHGRDAVVRNGFQPARSILTGVGPVVVRMPKFRCRTAYRAVFHSSVVPRYLRSTHVTSRESVWRYLHGVHGCDLNQVLFALLGPQAAHVAGLVPDSVRRAWLGECATKRVGPLADSGTVDLWSACIPADPGWAAVPSSMLAVIGADGAGKLRLLALNNAAGDERTRWIAVVRNLLDRGLRVPARIHLGAGAEAFGTALASVHDRTADAVSAPVSKVRPEPHTSAFGFALRTVLT